MTKPTNPNVRILGKTKALYELGDTGWKLNGMAANWASNEAADVMEYAGRACYQSFHKPNPDTADNEDYLVNIISQGHESVLEHASITLYITGVSRSFTHELVRHRHLSFSQQSQRYVDESEADYTIPPAIWGNPELEEVIKTQVEASQEAYKQIVTALEAEGLGRKQAREAARGVLPNCIETRIVVTGNIRAWRHFVKLRGTAAADAEIRGVAGAVYYILEDISPALVEGLPEPESELEYEE